MFGSIIKLCCYILFAPVLIFIVACISAVYALKFLFTVIFPKASRFIILSISAIVTLALMIYAFRRERDAMEFLESLLPPTETSRRLNLTLIFSELVKSINAEILSKFGNERQKVRDFVKKLR